MTADDLAIGAAGGLLLLVALADIVVTVLAYDGFAFVATHYQQLVCRLMRSGRQEASDVGDAPGGEKSHGRDLGRRRQDRAKAGPRFICLVPFSGSRYL